MPNYQYSYSQPQMGGYGQQMPVYQQQAYQSMQPMQNMQTDQALLCRMVTSADEARGVPVDFSGRPMTFLNLPRGTIYVKTFNPGTGAADFAEYRRVDPQEEAPAATEAFAPMSMVRQLQDTVEKLREELKNMRTTRRRAQEVTENDD